MILLRVHLLLQIKVKAFGRRHGNGLWWKKLDAFAESNFLIWVRVDVLQEFFNALQLKIGSIIRLLVEPKWNHQVSELVFIENTVTVSVNSLEHANEESQKLFVLFQLEI